MTNLPEKTEIKNAIQAYCQTKGISMNVLATQAKVSGATLSNIVNDKWGSIDDKMWKQIWNHVTPSTVAKLFNTTDYNDTIMLAVKRRKTTI